MTRLQEPSERPGVAHSPRSQNARVLRMLRHVGPTGLSQLECDTPLDGGPPIRRLASRITDLRRDGHPILTLAERRRKMAVYVLQTESDR